MNYVIREMTETEYPLLKRFCYESIFIPNGAEIPPFSIVEHPLLKVYYEGFGTEKHDHALVAEINGHIVGAVWVRIMNDFGHIDNKTPSLAVSLYKDYRGFGIGTAMMKRMLDLLKYYGYEKVSLSCQKANYAVRMYRHVGFDVFDENEEEYIMVRFL